MQTPDDFSDDSLIWQKHGLPNQITADENIVLVVREDLIIIGFKIAGFILLFLLLLLLKLVLYSFNFTAILYVYDVLFYSLSLVLIVTFSYVFHNYFLSIQIVTTKRLIDIDQTGLFKREVNELPIEAVQDVTYRQNSFFASVFGYGTVSVQTAADVSPAGAEKAVTGGFVFENVPKPQRIHAIINSLFHQRADDEARNNARLNAQAIGLQFGQNINPPHHLTDYSASAVNAFPNSANSNYDNHNTQQTPIYKESFKQKLEQLKNEKNV